MIQIDNVIRNYQAGDTVVKALRGVSLSIDQGEFVSIAGPSGSGKSTLLNLVGCIDKTDGGSIQIDGLSVADKTPKDLAQFRKEKLGFIFQSFNLIPVLSAKENVSFTLSIQGIRDKEAEERTLQILEEVGLSDKKDKRPSQLSGGQQQRVAIARALVKSPSIVLADEPTANLDSRTGEDILKLMVEMNRKHNTTFIFSTHDPMVMDYAKRLVMLHDGLIQSDERRP